MKERTLATAQIGRTHGFEGFVRIHPFSGEYDHLMKLSACSIKLRDGRLAEVSVRDIRLHADSMLMRFDGYETKEKAAKLSGGTMYISRDEGPHLEEGEYYIADLFGLTVLCGGQKAGTVDSVCDGAQADYLLIKLIDGRQVLVPNLPVFVSRPDFENRTITVLDSALLEK